MENVYTTCMQITTAEADQKKHEKKTCEIVFTMLWKTGSFRERRQLFLWTFIFWCQRRLIQRLSIPYLHRVCVRWLFFASIVCKFHKCSNATAHIWLHSDEIHCMRNEQMYKFTYLSIIRWMDWFDRVEPKKWMHLLYRRISHSDIVYIFRFYWAHATRAYLFAIRNWF